LKIYIGIDVGANGGYCIMNSDGVILTSAVLGDLEIFMKEMQGCCTQAYHAVFERVHAMPGQGVSSMFTFGHNVGMIEGILKAYGVPYSKVTPQSWQKEIHVGIDKKLDPKERSRRAAAQLFPHSDFRKSERCKKAHDGIVDAVLIAEYARRKNL
jgi:hypothetical protein